MNVAILGAGNVGSALAKASVAAGHKVTIASTTQTEAAQVASHVGARAADRNDAAVTGSEPVILAVPWAAVSTIVRELGPRLKGSTLARKGDGGGSTSVPCAGEFGGTRWQVRPTASSFGRALLAQSHPAPYGAKAGG